MSAVSELGLKALRMVLSSDKYDSITSALQVVKKELAHYPWETTGLSERGVKALRMAMSSNNEGEVIAALQFAKKEFVNFNWKKFMNGNQVFLPAKGDFKHLRSEKHNRGVLNMVHKKADAINDLLSTLQPGTSLSTLEIADHKTVMLRESCINKIIESDKRLLAHAAVGRISIYGSNNFGGGRMPYWTRKVPDISVIPVISRAQKASNCQTQANALVSSGGISNMESSIEHQLRALRMLGNASPKRTEHVIASATHTARVLGDTAKMADHYKAESMSKDAKILRLQQLYQAQKLIADQALEFGLDSVTSPETADA